MDYKTKPTSRKDLRRYAPVLRKLFGVSSSGPFPVLLALDKISDVFTGSCYTVVEDKKLPKNTMARCVPNDMGGITIEIKESTYNGAYRGIGAYRGFICHEICHIFLFNIGFVPVFDCNFEEGVIPAYCSVEWQAKALCAEVMIPYGESIGMRTKDLMQYYKVSKAIALNRVKM